MALDLGVHVNVRMNIDRNNIHQLPALADEIIARGWDHYEEFSTYTAPIHAANEHTDMHTTFGSWELNQALQALRQQYPSMQVIRSQEDGLADRARQLFAQRQDPLSNFKASFCGAHTKMYIFDAFGDIYACWEHTGDPSIRIGTVTEARTWRSTMGCTSYGGTARSPRIRSAASAVMPFTAAEGVRSWPWSILGSFTPTTAMALANASVPVWRKPIRIMSRVSESMSGRNGSAPRKDFSSVRLAASFQQREVISMEDNMETDQQGSISGATSEVTNLNIDSLDVQELERRLELVAAAPDDNCGVYWIAR